MEVLKSFDTRFEVPNSMLKTVEQIEVDEALEFPDFDSLKLEEVTASQITTQITDTSGTEVEDSKSKLKYSLELIWLQCDLIKNTTYFATEVPSAQSCYQSLVKTYKDFLREVPNMDGIPLLRTEDLTFKPIRSYTGGKYRNKKIKSLPKRRKRQKHSKEVTLGEVMDGRVTLQVGNSTLQEVSSEELMRDLKESQKSDYACNIDLEHAKLEEVSCGEMLSTVHTKEPEGGPNRRLKVLLSSNISDKFTFYEASSIASRIAFGNGFIDQSVSEEIEVPSSSYSGNKINVKAALYWDNKRLLTSSIYYLVAKVGPFPVRDVDILPLQGLQYQTGLVSKCMQCFYLR